MTLSRLKIVVFHVNYLTGGGGGGGFYLLSLCIQTVAVFTNFSSGKFSDFKAIYKCSKLSVNFHASTKL